MLWRLFHKCRLDEYRTDTETWAVVTGSTSGIGKSLAEELLKRGFNVMVHGRSPAKLESVVDYLTAKYPDRQIDSVIADFNRLQDVSNIPKAIENKHVTVFINNAAATDMVYTSFTHTSDESIDMNLSVGVQFLTKLIRKTLPILIRNGKSVMLNVGSGAGRVPCPYVSIYSASKGFLLSLTKCLALEAKLSKSPVTIMYAEVHNVNSGTNHSKIGLTTPSSEGMARSLLNVIGCKRAVVTPYWFHELTSYFMVIIPQSFIEDAITRKMDKHVERRASSQEKVS